MLSDLVEKVQRRYLESNFFAIALLKVTFSIESKFIKVVYGHEGRIQNGVANIPNNMLR